MKQLAPARETRRLVAPPISIGCIACNGQFFTASLPIHQKACFQRNAFVLIPCEKCKTCVRACDFHSHSTSCSGNPLSTKSGVSGLNDGAIKQQINLPPMNLNLPDADGRIRCKICERAFSQDRISKHQSVCHGKPRSKKENQEPKQRSPIIHSSSRGNSSAKPPRKTVHIQRIVASRTQEMTVDFGRERSSRGRSVHVVESSSQRMSCGYPGAQSMQGGGCDTSNASSACNPLVTNSLMALRR